MTSYNTYRDYFSQLSNNADENIGLTAILLDDLARANVVELYANIDTVATAFYARLLRNSPGRDVKKFPRSVKGYRNVEELMQQVEGMRYTCDTDAPDRPLKVRDINLEDGQVLMPLVQI